jgi:outer membrane lipoprotein-sorting protein
MIDRIMARLTRATFHPSIHCRFRRDALCRFVPAAVPTAPDCRERPAGTPRSGNGPPSIKWRRRLAAGLLFALIVPVGAQTEPDARAIVEAAHAYMRGKASVAVVDMTIHRSDWERTVAIKAWTKGRDESIFVILAPPKDEGNGTLKKGVEMWMYNPRVDRTIKIPPSMMAQSWMGSDFSNNDLAKSDSLLDDYTHRVIGRETDAGQPVYVIESLPKPAAPVIWGMQRLKIRADHIFLEESFYDEDRRLVKTLRCTGIQILGGKLFPRVWTMMKAEDPNAYTRLDYRSLEFLDSLPDNLFTQAALRHPPR